MNKKNLKSYFACRFLHELRELDRVQEEEDKKELLRLLQSYLKKDPVKAAVVDMTPLNIVEVTRKKVEKSLEEEMKRRKDWEK